MATVATLAFTLYLTHKQMIHFAKVSIENYGEHPWLTGALASGLIVLAALILHYSVERPFLRWRDKLMRSDID